jgi:hypothetical protein
MERSQTWEDGYLGQARQKENMGEGAANFLLGSFRNGPHRVMLTGR